jgi:hypothetical protein
LINFQSTQQIQQIIAFHWGYCNMFWHTLVIIRLTLNHWTFSNSYLQVFLFRTLLTLQNYIPRALERLKVWEQQVKIHPTPRKQTRDWCDGKHNAHHTHN